jgi:hypothetical protein
MIPKIKARTSLIQIFIFILFASSHLIAQSFSVGLLGNFNFPYAPKSFKDSFTTGTGLGGEFKYCLSNRTSLRFNARYQSQNIKTDDSIIIDALVGNSGGEGVTYNVKGGDMAVSSLSTSIIHYIIKSRRFLNVYFTIGGSFHFIKTNDLFVDATFEGQTILAIAYYAPEESVVILGIQEGFGLEKQIKNRFSIFTEIEYNYFFTGSLTKEYIWDYNYDPDLRLSYITLLAGVRLSFLL